MYWPIGAAQVYAPSRHSSKNSKHHGDAPPEPSDQTRHQTSDDGLSRDEQCSSSKDESTTRTSSSADDRPTSPAPPQPSSSPLPTDIPLDSTTILSLTPSRTTTLFTTLTATTLSIYHTRPTLLLLTLTRSAQSLSLYGANVSVHLRPDASVLCLLTEGGYLVIYSLAFSPSTSNTGGLGERGVYHQTFSADDALGHTRRTSYSHGQGWHTGTGAGTGTGMREGGALATAEGQGVREVQVRFRMVIRVEAGVECALAGEEEVVVGTRGVGAVQCIRWTNSGKGEEGAGSGAGGRQTETEVLGKMEWIAGKEGKEGEQVKGKGEKGRKKVVLREMVYDRPMNLSSWITSDGRGFAVQRVRKREGAENGEQKGLFKGYCFHNPESEELQARKAAINARFSLIAVGCGGGEILVYTARDYAGHVPLSHRLRAPVSIATSGSITFLSYSPDGYCLFAGYEKGWAMWSVFGKPGAHSFGADRSLSQAHEDGWLLGIKDGFWVGAGSGLMLLGQNSDCFYLVEMARSAVAGCFSSANVSRSLLLTDTAFMLYRGYDVPDLTTISGEAPLWQTIQVPARYLIDQWPLRSAVISADGRYVAIAGRRGLVHYSVNSGRWKTFEDPIAENEFTVRGGMCWHQHVLIAAVDAGEYHEVRLFSREAPLDLSRLLHVEALPAPIVHLAPSGEDSLLVYTYENILYHFIITASTSSVRLVQVGQIAFHGIIRAPLRVRAVSWILPDHQLQHGDPSQDVATASVIFLVDGKLVLLQPSTNHNGELKYDMRVVAHNVEYFSLMRDQPSFNLLHDADELPPSPQAGDVAINGYHGHGLRDSLWLFDGTDMRVWTDVQDVLASAAVELGRELPAAVRAPVDFYPLSALLNKGILFGIEPELVQRRDISFASSRFSTRTHLFLPPLLRYHLSQYNSPAALHISHHYRHLAYFPHALEILLHDVLDDEVDHAPSPETALLPSVLSFLSSFPQFLDIVVQCTRKTEVRSWRTLFAHLPPVQELFEESLARDNLKTAGGYLLVLHTFEDVGQSSRQTIRLLERAKAEGDWELCKELARFLMALDESGDTLREALEIVHLKTPRPDAENTGFLLDDSMDGRLNLPSPHLPQGRTQSSGHHSRSRGEDTRQPGRNSIANANGVDGSTIDAVAGISGRFEQMHMGLGLGLSSASSFTGLRGASVGGGGGGATTSPSPGSASPMTLNGQRAPGSGDDYFSRQP